MGRIEETDNPQTFVDLNNVLLINDWKIRKKNSKDIRFRKHQTIRSNKWIYQDHRVQGQDKKKKTKLYI